MPRVPCSLLDFESGTATKPHSVFFLVSRRSRAYRSTVGQPAKRLPGIFGRFGQDCFVITNPMLDAHSLEQVVLTSAYASNSRRCIVEAHSKPSAINWCDHRLPFPITERSDRHVVQLDQSAKRNLEHEVKLNE